MTRTSAQAMAYWVKQRAREAEARCAPEPGTHALPGHCSGCGAPVLLVNLRWVDRDVPMIHDCAG